MSYSALCKMLVTCCGLLLVAPTHAHADSAAEAQIKGENARWAEAYSQGDYAAIGELYTSDGMLLPPGEERVVGQASIVAYFSNKSNGSRPNTIRFSNFEFYGNDSTMTEISDTEIRDHTGKVISRGRQTLIFLRQGGVWKLHRDMWNSNVPLEPR